MYATVTVALSPTSSEYEPFTSVVVPLKVPLTKTCAPTNGSPESLSDTLPVNVCAIADVKNIIATKTNLVKKLIILICTP